MDSPLGIYFICPAYLLEKAIKLLEIGVVSYAGIDLAIDELSEFLLIKFNGLPADLLQIFLIMKVDAGFKIVLTAMSFAISFKLAHNSINLTMRYAHLSPDHLLDAVKFRPAIED